MKDPTPQQGQEEMQKLLVEWEQHIMVGGDSPWTNAKKMKTCQSILTYIGTLEAENKSLHETMKNLVMQNRELLSDKQDADSRHKQEFKRREALEAGLSRAVEALEKIANSEDFHGQHCEADGTDQVLADEALSEISHLLPPADGN